MTQTPKPATQQTSNGVKGHWCSLLLQCGNITEKLLRNESTGGEANQSRRHVYLKLTAVLTAGGKELYPQRTFWLFSDQARVAPALRLYPPFPDVWNCTRVVRGDGADDGWVFPPSRPSDAVDAPQASLDPECWPRPLSQQVSPH